ncbi:MAG TPA: His/Gly/Thr/Pro-type tRNA ligase C-terminal domain-containing protein, partial [Candidatus Dojkabacteria bacterium]|nr:His/Gly/Thr/Pro-type tRNA ligase C-terminal domain-containing protein [Candidatus Dojkabacteria bacterium]
FPFWLAPEQIRILTIKEDYNNYAKEILMILESNRIRAEVDYRNISLSDKMKSAHEYKIPYLLIIGDKELKNKVVTVRNRVTGEQEVINKDSIVEYFSNK